MICKERDPQEHRDSDKFTNSAEEKNAENLLVIRDRGLAARYTKNWEAHLGHSVVY